MQPGVVILGGKLDRVERVGPVVRVAGDQVEVVVERGAELADDGAAARALACEPAVAALVVLAEERACDLIEYESMCDLRFIGGSRRFFLSEGEEGIDMRGGENRLVVGEFSYLDNLNIYG